MEEVELKDKFIDEKTGIEYIREGDYYIPNLKLKNQITRSKLNKFAKMRFDYLYKNKKAKYLSLMLNNKLKKHLEDIDKIANERYELLIKQFAKQENITEELKQKDQLEWVRSMNNIKNRVEEIILKELIYD